MSVDKIKAKNKIKPTPVIKIKDDCSYSWGNLMERSPEEISQRIKYQANLIKVQGRDLRTALKLITYIPSVLLSLESDITMDKLSSSSYWFKKILIFHNSMKNLWEKLWENKYYIYLSTSHWKRQPLELRIEEIIYKTETIIKNFNEKQAIKEARIKILKMLLEQTLSECHNRIVVWK